MSQSNGALIERFFELSAVKIQIRYYSLHI